MMGHTIESARFAGLLGLLVIVGVAGLAGKDVSVDSMAINIQAGSVDSSALPAASYVLNQSAATEPVLLMVPVSTGDAEPDVNPGIPFLFGSTQTNHDVSGEQDILENSGELQRLVFDADAVGWQQRQLNIISDRSF